MSAQKALHGFETEVKELLGGTEEHYVSPLSGYVYPIWSGPPNILLLSPSLQRFMQYPICPGSMPNRWMDMDKYGIFLHLPHTQLLVNTNFFHPLTTLKSFLLFSLSSTDQQIRVNFSDNDERVVGFPFFQHNDWVCRVVFQETGTAFRPPPLILYAPNLIQFYEFLRYFRGKSLY